MIHLAAQPDDDPRVLINAIVPRRVAFSHAREGRVQ